jgi:hypothetical protein
MKIMMILENEIDTKKKHLLQLVELHRTLFPQPEEVKRMLHHSYEKSVEGIQSFYMPLFACMVMGKIHQNRIINYIHDMHDIFSIGPVPSNLQNIVMKNR